MNRGVQLCRYGGYVMRAPRLGRTIVRKLSKCVVTRGRKALLVYGLTRRRHVGRFSGTWKVVVTISFSNAVIRRGCPRVNERLPFTVRALGGLRRRQRHLVL